MPSNFEFNDLKPFSEATFEQFRQVYMLQGMNRQWRAAAKTKIYQLSIGVIDNLPSRIKQDSLSVLVPPDQDSPDGWSLVVRYRTDKPWYLVICLCRAFAFTGKHFEPGGQPFRYVEDSAKFFGQRLVKIGYFNELESHPFVARFLYHAVQEYLKAEPNWCILDAVIHHLQEVLPATTIVDLYSVLTNTEFFADSDEDCEYQIDLQQDILTWTEFEKNTKALYPSFAARGVIPQLSRSADTFLYTARSKLQPLDDLGDPSDQEYPTALSYLLGGIDPSSDGPRLHAVITLPDERRRGIATTLLKCFLNHTKYPCLTAELFFSDTCEPYEGAKFLTDCGFVLRKRRKHAWQFYLSTEATQNFLASKNNFQKIK